MNIVTKFSFLFIDLFYFFLFYLFILHPRHLKDFFVFFFRALGEPLDQDSVPVGQSLNIHQSINQSMTFPQLRRDDAPHLPDSSRMSTSRFKKVGIFFFCCLLENGWGNPVETSCFETLTAGVVRKKY